MPAWQIMMAWCQQAVHGQQFCYDMDHDVTHAWPHLTMISFSSTLDIPSFWLCNSVPALALEHAMWEQAYTWASHGYFFIAHFGIKSTISCTFKANSRDDSTPLAVSLSCWVLPVCNCQTSSRPQREGGLTYQLVVEHQPAADLFSGSAVSATCLTNFHPAMLTNLKVTVAFLEGVPATKKQSLWWLSVVMPEFRPFCVMSRPWWTVTNRF